MTTTCAPDDLDDVVRRLTTPKREYDRDTELLDAGGFVADFGTFPDVFDTPDLFKAQQWLGSRIAAWYMLAHWSVMRGDPGFDPQDPFLHANFCDTCSYLEQVAALRVVFEYEDCHDCGRGLPEHDISPDAIGNPHAYCRQMWTRQEPVVAPGGDVAEGQCSDAFGARYAARTAAGDIALITRTYYLGREWNAHTQQYDGPEFMFREDEYLVCGSLTDPGGTERGSDYMTTRFGDPASMEPRQMAIEAPEPDAGEWQRHAPGAYKNALDGTATT